MDIDANHVVSKANVPLGGDSDGEDEDPEHASTTRGPRAFDQRDLVAQAFAGDNVIKVSVILDCGRIVGYHF